MLKSACTGTTDDTMYDLEAIERMFHEFFDPRLGELAEEIEITEDLLEKGKTIHIPFGFFKYRLVLEGEKPVLRIRVTTRMDTNMIYLVDGEKVRIRDKMRR